MIKTEGIFHVSQALNTTVKVCMGVCMLVALFKLSTRFWMPGMTIIGIADWAGLIATMGAYVVLCHSLVGQKKQWGWLLVLAIVGEICGKLLNNDIATVVGGLSEIIVVVMLLVYYTKYISYYAIGYLASAFVGVFLGMGYYIFQNDIDATYYFNVVISITLSIIDIICYYYLAKSFTEK